MQSRQFIAGLAAITLCLTLCTSIEAQQNNPIFSGGGVQTGAAPGSLQGNTRAFDFSKLGQNTIGESPKLFNLPKFELPKIEPPKIKWPQWMQGKQQDGALSANNLFAPRDPNQPSFFERLNNRTKEIFGRTKENITGQAQMARDKTIGNLNSMGNGSSLKSDLNNVMQKATPAQPPLRQAQRLNVEPKVRY